MQNNKKRNTPIVTLIRNFVNKESGKVSESRKEIRRRFPALDWKDQKKIISAFLDSCASDREWMYTRLFDYWDDCFAEQIKSLWEKYHEDKCAWVVIRFLPENYVKSQIDHFPGGRNYYFVCRRLAHNEDFQIERNKLSAIDYLSVIFYSGKNLSDDEATEIFYKIVCEECEKENMFIDMRHVGRGVFFALRDFAVISKALYYLESSNKTGVLETLEAWGENVAETIRLSEEYATLKKAPLSDYEYNDRLKSIAKSYIADSLGVECKENYMFLDARKRLEELERKNPVIDSLIDKLGLECVE